jgi:hypothetical protein
MAYSRTTDLTMYKRYTQVSSNGSTLQTFRIVQGSPYQIIKSGQSVPKYRSIIKNRGNAFSPYSIEATNLRYISPFGVRSVRRAVPEGGPFYAETWDGYNFESMPSFGSLDSSAADTLALTRCYKRLSEAQSHVNGMQFLGELHEVVSMFKHPYRSAVRLVDQYVSNVAKAARKTQPRRSGKGRKQFEKAVADAWLETAFGLKPLISDVKGLAEAAARFQYDSRREKLIGSAEVPIFQNTMLVNLGNQTNYIIGNCNESRRTVARVKYTAYMDWSRSAAFGSVNRLGELVGFRADLFIPTLYELTPWSFLVDYFTNLGTVIETGCASQANVKFVMKSVQLECEQTSVTYGTPSLANIPVISFIDNPGVMKLVRKKFIRSNYAQLPSVPFTFELPGSASKYANILALWSSKMRSI